MSSSNTLRKCPHCGNLTKLSYEGSRNINSKGDLKDIILNQELWISYYKCPICQKYDLDMHPVGKRPFFDDFKDITNYIDKLLEKSIKD